MYNFVLPRLGGVVATVLGILTAGCKRVLRMYTGSPFLPPHSVLEIYKYIKALLSHGISHLPEMTAQPW